jgi:hypothetical protein
MTAPVANRALSVHRARKSCPNEHGTDAKTQLDNATLHEQTDGLPIHGSWLMQLKRSLLQSLLTFRPVNTYLRTLSNTVLHLFG